MLYKKEWLSAEEKLNRQVSDVNKMILTGIEEFRIWIEDLVSRIYK